MYIYACVYVIIDLELIKIISLNSMHLLDSTNHITSTWKLINWDVTKMKIINLFMNHA